MIARHFSFYKHIVVNIYFSTYLEISKPFLFICSRSGKATIVLKHNINYVNNLKQYVK